MNLRAALALALLLAACGGGSGRGDGGYHSPPHTCDPNDDVDPSSVETQADFIAAVFAIECRLSVRCEVDQAINLGQAFCHPDVVPQTIAAAADGGLPPFNLATARACITAANAATCDSMTIPACNASFNGRGDLPNGASCTSQYQCASGICTATTCPRTSGNCVARTPSGGACDLTDQCELGLACRSGTCLAPLPDGAPCTTRDDCTPPSGCIDSICSAGRPRGAACTTGWFGGSDCAPPLVCDGFCTDAARLGAPCAPGTCERGSHCSDAGICTRRALDGCPCTTDDECPTTTFVCTLGTCVPRPFVGDACTVGGPTCIESVCTDGVCARLPLGAPSCYVDGTDECADGLVCSPFGGDPSAQHCIPRSALGAPCNFGECAEGLSCTAGTSGDVCTDSCAPDGGV